MTYRRIVLQRGRPAVEHTHQSTKTLDTTLKPLAKQNHNVSRILYKPQRLRISSRPPGTPNTISRTFASSETEPSRTSRTLEGSTPRSGKERCATIAARANSNESGIQRLAASLRAGTSLPSKHRRTCFARLHSSLRCKIWCRHRRISITTLWTLTTSCMTTFCGM